MKIALEVYLLFLALFSIETMKPPSKASYRHYIAE